MDDIFFHGPNKKIAVHNNQMNTQQQQVFMVLLVFGILLLTTLSPHHNRAETPIDILMTKTTGWGGTLGAIGGVGMGLAVLAALPFAGVSSATVVAASFLMPAVAGTLGRAAGHVIEGRRGAVGELVSDGAKKLLYDSSKPGTLDEWMKRERNGGKEPEPPRQGTLDEWMKRERNGGCFTPPRQGTLDEWMKRERNGGKEPRFYHAGKI